MSLLTDNMRDALKSIIGSVPGGPRLIKRYIKYKYGHLDIAQVFTSHYDDNSWLDPESRSGPGSTLVYTENLRRELPQIFASLNIRRILDAPCGDFNWFQHVDRGENIEYIGADIVAPLIERNMRAYGNKTTRFICLDITRDTLPSVDFWMCRDCLFHLAEREVFLALHNFVSSDIEWLFTTTHHQWSENVNIKSGGFRQLNLQKEPYNLPEPVLGVDDWIEGFPVRKMALWRRSQLQQALRANRAYRTAVKLK